MPLSEDISRIVAVFQRIGGREGVWGGQLPRAPAEKVAKFVKGEGTQPAISEPQVPCGQSRCPWCLE